MKKLRYIFSALVLLFCIYQLQAQEVPYGINYQAVARNAMGEELVNSQIDIRFSVVSGTPLGPLEYQEVHTGVSTTRYGVFSVIIGYGTPVAGEKENFKDLTWETSVHYLKVEIKFSSDYQEVGTMQFLSVPYALYAGKSLEPGPVGPQGPAGDPATDDQTLSFDGINLSISGGNQVNLANLLNVEDDDPDPANEIQDLDLTDDILKITKNIDAHEYDLSVYKDNTDAQTLNFEPSNSLLTISGGGNTSLAALVNTDQQQLSYNSETYELGIDNGNTVSIGELVAFRATFSTSIAVPNNINVPLIFDNEIYDDDSSYDYLSGIFTAKHKGNYTLNVSLNLPFGSCSAVVMINGTNEYETIIGPTSRAGVFRASVTLRLMAGEEVTIAVKQTNGFPIDPFNISGSFSGFRVY